MIRYMDAKVDRNFLPSGRLGQANVRLAIAAQGRQVASLDTEMVGLGARNPAEITAED